MHTLDSFFVDYKQNKQQSNPEQIILSCTRIETPLGSIVVIADDEALYFLEFLHQPLLAKKMLNLAKKAHATLIQDTSEPMRLFEQELAAYFAGTSSTFITPVKLFGTPFQISTWRALQTIPYGHTVSYTQLAIMVGNPTAHRAVANANGKNFLSIIIPCHRVINTNGELGGYSSGIERKAWLLNHETTLIRQSA